MIKKIFPSNYHSRLRSSLISELPNFEIKKEYSIQPEFIPNIALYVVLTEVFQV